MSRQSRFPHPLLVVLLAPFGVACGNGGNGGPPDGGDGGLPSYCTNPTTAQSDMRCEINVISPPAADAGVVGQPYYIDKVGEELWLWIQLPSSVTGSTLFNLIAYYDVQSTPVELALNVLEADQKTSIARAVDKHGAGAPVPLNVTFAIDPQTTPAGSLVWVQLTDATNSHVDLKNPLFIFVDLQSDPDPMGGPVNFSGDPTVGETATCPDGDGGACGGVLSVTGRTDTYDINIPSGISRPILYLHVTGAGYGDAGFPTPPPAYTTAFNVLDPTGKIIYTGSLENNFIPVDLAAAILLNLPTTSTSTYQVQVYGINPMNTSLPAPGDLRVSYNLDLLLLQDLDANEGATGNDVIDDATSVSLSAMGAQPTIKGRLAYFNDNDWYAISMPAGQYSRLHYKVTPTTVGGRYPPIDGPPARELSLVTYVPQGTQACLAGTAAAGSSVCPVDPGLIASVGYESSNAFQLIQNFCDESVLDGGALCLQSHRDEPQAVAFGFQPLQNFEGIIPVDNTQQTVYLELYALNNAASSSGGGTYCDDLEYDLDLDWEPAANQPSGLPNTNGLPGPLNFGTLGASSTASGSIDYGYGYLVQYDLTETPPIDVRGQSDYDAVPSTADTWEVDFPSAYTSAADGASWALSWTVSGGAGGSPENLILAVTMCDASQSTANCVPLQTPNNQDGVNGAIYYNPQQMEDLPWWDPQGSGWLFGNNYMNYASLWDVSGNTITASPFSCTCFPANALAYGKFYVTVLGADRTSWQDTAYTLTMGIGPYSSESFTHSGSSFACPEVKTQTITDDAGMMIDGGPVSGDVGCQYINGYN